MKYTQAIILLMLFALLMSCSSKSTELEFYGLKDNNYPLVRAEFLSLYMNQSPLYNDITPNPADANGVPLFSYNNQLYYHPVMIGHRVIWALSDYNNTHDEKYLTFAKNSLQALIDRSTREANKMYFPYMFDFSPWATTVTYTAPWYSGMAQGVLLSAISRLYYFTEDNYYKSVADSVFNTFRDFDSPISTVYISKNNGMGVEDDYYWVDEYPHEVRRFVLNGSISGSFGLYDYWWVFNNEKARKLFSMQMTTIKKHILLYRNPGKISFYCLKFKDLNSTYHVIHQKLLNQCFLYTGDHYFTTVSYVFFTDYH